MASIGCLPRENHQFMLFGRRFYGNTGQPLSWIGKNVTETKVWAFHDRIAACDWADKMAAIWFGCQVIDVDQGFRVYENNWYDIQAHVLFNTTARCSDARYADMEQGCVNNEQQQYKVYWPRRSGCVPHPRVYGYANLQSKSGVKT